MIQKAEPTKEVAKKLVQYAELKDISLLFPEDQSFFVHYHIDFLVGIVVLVMLMRKCCSFCCARPQVTKSKLD